LYRKKEIKKKTLPYTLKIFTSMFWMGNDDGNVDFAAPRNEKIACRTDSSTFINSKP
jgi:hypothetical protein